MLVFMHVLCIFHLFYSDICNSEKRVLHTKLGANQTVENNNLSVVKKHINYSRKFRNLTIYRWHMCMFC